MSVHVLSWVLRHSPVENHPQRLTLICLADKANEDGTGAYPGIPTIMRETKIKSRTTARQALQELERAGHIEYEGTSHLQTKSWRVLMVPQTGEPANDPPAKTGSADDPKPSLEPPSEQRSLEDGLQDGSGSILGPPPPTPGQDAAWQQARAALEHRAAEQTWQIWLDPLELAHVTGRHHYVLASPPHATGYVANRYSSMITAALRTTDPAATIEIQDAPQGSRAAGPRERGETVAHEEEEPCTTP